MLPSKYRTLGLTGLARCHDSPWHSHFPAAVLAGYYLAAGQPLDAATEIALTRQIDLLVATHPSLFSPYPTASAAHDRSAPIVAALELSIDRFSELGHNAIFSAYALRALQDTPEFDSAEAISDLAATIRGFNHGPARYWLHLDISKGHDPRTFTLPVRTLLPNTTDNKSIARLILTELTRFRHIYTQMGSKSHIGHLLTQSHALITLRKLGLVELANRGLQSLETRLVLLRDSQGYRAGPRSFYKPATRSPLLPTEASFWQQDFAPCQWDEGHIFKYSLAFYELAELASDEKLIAAAAEKLRYLLSPNERSQPR